MKRCIINAYTGEGWFANGQLRLIGSLNGKKAPDVDVFAFNEHHLKDSEYYYPDCPYTIKAAALDRAIKLGYDQILWLDCSVTAMKSLGELWELIDRDGYYFMAGGWNCAQECNDKSLEYFNYTRDEAELIHSLWSCIFALDLRNEKAKKVAELFLQAAKDKIFHGSRNHDNQSSDPRFKHHRQDQSVLSLAFHRVGLETFHPPQIHMYYAGMGKELESNLFRVQGGV